MLVTVSIFAIISAIVIVRNAQFDDETLLHNLAYDIALSIRQAQQFGVNVRGTTGTFDEAYGLHFQAGADTYEFFLDGDGDGLYNPNNDQLLETYTIGRGSRIGVLCDLDAGSSTCSAQETLDVVFRRPNPDAVINNNTIGLASIELVSARETGQRLIMVQSTGQISIVRPKKDEQGGGGELEI